MWNQQPNKYGEVFRIGPNTFIPPPSSSFIPTSSRLSPGPSEPRRSSPTPTPTSSTPTPQSAEPAVKPKTLEPVQPQLEIKPTTSEGLTLPKTQEHVQPQQEIQPVILEGLIVPKTPEPVQPQQEIQPALSEELTQPKTPEQPYPEIQTQHPSTIHEPMVSPAALEPDVNQQTQLEEVTAEQIEFKDDTIDSDNTLIKVQTDVVKEEENVADNVVAKEVGDKIIIQDEKVIIIELNDEYDIAAVDVESHHQPDPVIVESNFEKNVVHPDVIPEIQFEIEEIKSEIAADIPQEDYEKVVPEDEVHEVHEIHEVQNLQSDAGCEFPVDPPPALNQPPLLISAQVEIVSAQIVTETGKTKIT